MKVVRQVLLALIAIAAIGMLVFLIQKTRSVNGELHLQRLAEIRTINKLDVQLNRALTQSRVSSESAEGDDLAKTTRQLGDALDAVDKGPASLHGLSPQLNKTLDTFLNTIEDKLELGSDFEARSLLINERLVNSMDAVPDRSADVISAGSSADAAFKEQMQGIITQLKVEIITYATTPSPTNGPNIHSLLDQLDKLGTSQPQAFQDATKNLQAACQEVLEDKNDLTNKLNSFLDRPTGPQLQAVEKAYSAWHESQVAVASQYRQLLVAYAAILLLVLALLGIRLLRSLRELDRANETLEAQVQERTKDLSRALLDLRASQTQLVQSEKMASLGQMVAGVAHEINTPLGYARSNAEIVRASLTDIRQLCTAQTRALKLMTEENTSDEEVAQALTEAHERGQTVNAEELAGDLDSLLADTDHGLLQIAELVASLKDFSRVDRTRTDLFNVNDGLDSSLKIGNNLLKNRIEVVKSYGVLPQIECSPSQLNQVFLNLITNAAQAIDGNGKIYLHTTADADGVNVRILDTGSGMPEEVRKRIFEPFFTTKPVGKGTGLGLSIVFRIIEDHGGRIDVRSIPGKGSEFVIFLPLRQARTAEPAHKPDSVKLIPYLPALAPA